MSDTTNNKNTKDDLIQERCADIADILITLQNIASTNYRRDCLIQERCADVLTTLQNIASTNYRSAYNLPFYMDKAKEIERMDGITKALSELEDIWKHPRKYKNIIHLLNAVCESSEAVKRNNIVE